MRRSGDVHASSDRNRLDGPVFIAISDWDHTTDRPAAFSGANDVKSGILEPPESVKIRMSGFLRVPILPPRLLPLHLGVDLNRLAGTLPAPVVQPAALAIPQNGQTLCHLRRLHCAGEILGIPVGDGSHLVGQVVSVAMLDCHLRMLDPNKSSVLDEKNKHNPKIWLLWIHQFRPA